MDTSRIAGRRTGEPSRGNRNGAGGGTFFCLSEDETSELGRTVGRGLRGGELVLLEGDLGAGKTTFTRGLAAGLGVDPREVTSPSFTLVQEYRGGRAPLFHVDLYRLETVEDDVPALGIEDILAAGGIVIVEWGEKLPPFLKRGALAVRFHDVGEGSRRIEIAPQAGGAPKPASDA